MAGEKETGVTLMEMVAAMDAGKMYDKEIFPLLPEDNYSSACQKIADCASHLIVKDLLAYANQTLEGEEQKEKDVTIANKIKPEDEHLPLYLSVEGTLNYIRGLSEEPGAYILLNEKKLKIYQAHVENHDVFPGETITLANNPTAEPLPGYRKINPMVYCGLYPVDSVDYGALKDALEKLSLNDSSLTYEPESSQALGFGFRVGFLGLLHMDVVQERLEREYNLNLILTAPSVKYEVDLTNGETLVLDNPSEMPDPSKIKAIKEPFVNASIMTSPTMA